eukprot:9455662-Pyramimonas_sp.AAC.1
MASRTRRRIHGQASNCSHLGNNSASSASDSAGAALRPAGPRLLLPRPVACRMSRTKLAMSDGSICW